MDLIKKINYLLYPCQKEIDKMLVQHKDACSQLKTVVAERKAITVQPWKK